MQQTDKVAAVAFALALLAAPLLSGAHGDEPRAIDHVLLLSIDGLHAQDVARYVRRNPHSALAHLTHMGLTYTNASTSTPSDSFPGLLAMVTGGSPRSTGVFYDDSYDRNLSAPGSNCATKGTEVVYDESIDLNPAALDGGAALTRKPYRLMAVRGANLSTPIAFCASTPFSKSPGKQACTPRGPISTLPTTS